MLETNLYQLHQLPPPARHFLISFSNFESLFSLQILISFSFSQLHLQARNPYLTKPLSRSQIFNSFLMYQILISYFVLKFLNPSRQILISFSNF